MRPWVTAALGTTRTAACWLVVAGPFAYVANAQTSDVTGLKIGDDGSLSLLDADGITGLAAMGPVDEDVTDGGDFLYVINNGAHAISGFAIEDDGSLTKLPDLTGLPSVVCRESERGGVSVYARRVGGRGAGARLVQFRQRVRSGAAVQRFDGGRGVRPERGWLLRAVLRFDRPGRRHEVSRGGAGVQSVLRGGEGAAG